MPQEKDTIKKKILRILLFDKYKNFYKSHVDFSSIYTNLIISENADNSIPRTQYTHLSLSRAKGKLIASLV